MSKVQKVRYTVFPTNSDFVTSAIELLNDDIVWWRQHNTALAKQGLWSWEKAAKAFEELIII